ncbi:hypothetical protein Gotur_025986 [Gossypium turneri]
MRRRPQMVMASELQPSLEYIQWYYSCGKPYILGGQSAVVPPHMQQPGGSYLAGTDYFPSFSEGEYTYDFELFGSYLPGPYLQHHRTPSAASSSSIPNEGPASNDFLSMFTTPPPAPNDDVGHREHPERDRRPPNRYTPRTTPSNHQF